MIQRKTETYLSKFCSRTKRKTNIRDQQYKSHVEEVECFSTQKFIFPLTDSFPFKHWAIVWLKSLFLKIPVLLWDAEEGLNHRIMIKAHQIVLNQCSKCIPTNHPPSMNSHRGYNVTGKFARLDSIFTLKSLYYFQRVSKP